MNLEQQKEIIKLYYKYQTIDKDTIKTNLKNYMDDSKVKPSQMTEQTGIPIQTIYQLRKHNNNYKPDFIVSLIICNFLNTSITEVMKPIREVLEIPEPRTKWTEDAKRDFINDCRKMDITKLCDKYKLTERTVAEYFKNFVREIENEQ